MSAGIPSFFKTPRHRSFEYRPVFYDGQKERKKELERLVEENRTGELSDQRRLERLKGRLGQRLHSGDRTVRKQQSFNQRIRLIGILAVLAGLIWVFFNWV